MFKDCQTVDPCFADLQWNYPDDQIRSTPIQMAEVPLEGATKVLSSPRVCPWTRPIPLQYRQLLADQQSSSRLKFLRTPLSIAELLCVITGMERDLNNTQQTRSVEEYADGNNTIRTENSRAWETPSPGIFATLLLKMSNPENSLRWFFKKSKWTCIMLPCKNQRPTSSLMHKL